MRYGLLLFAIACSHSTVATAPAALLHEPATVKRIVINQGRVAGSLTSTYDHDTIRSTLHILENGRGPHVEAVMTVADDDTLLTLTAHGHHLMGTKVAENFERVAENAKWASEEEHGEVKNIGLHVMFVPQAEVPDAFALLVQAALKAGGTIALLPSGEATVTRAGDASVTAHGETRKLVCYAVTGLDFSPDYVWMNEDGSWFGSVDAWSSMVPEGWEATVAPLIEKQNALIHARDAELATAQTHRPPAAGLAFTHARVLDVEHGTWRADQTVVIVGDKIAAVGPKVTIPAGAEVVDLAGRALVPGLVDMHSHLGDSDGVLDIASGVTTVRDVGNDPDKLDDFKQRWDAGTAIGPHVYRMGFVEGRNEKAASSKITAETPDEAKAAVAFYAARHYDGMKIYNSIRPELIPIITAEAHARGMKVTGHIPVHVLANEAVRAGYDGIEHINMLFLNFFATHDTDTRDTTRFTLVGDRAAELDLDSAPVREFLALLKEHHTVIDPTADAFEDLFVAVPGKLTPGLEAMIARMPVNVQRGFLGGGLPLSGDKHALYLKSWAKMLAMIKLVHDQGILEVAGTDAIAGLMLHHELALFIQAGISPADALKMATIDAARALGIEATVGTIEPGKLADLVVIDGDPIARIDDITHVVTTIKGGVRFESAPLYETVGVRAYGK